MRALPRLAVAAILLLPLFAVTPAAADKIADKRAEAARLAAQLEREGVRLSQLAEQFNEARIETERVAAKLVATRAQVAHTAAEAKAAENLLRHAAVDAYVRGGALPVLPLLARGDGTDFYRRSQFVDAIANRQRDEIDALHEAKEDLESEQARLETDQEAANRATAALNEARNQARRAQAELQATSARVQGELAELVRAEEAKRQAEARRRAERELAERRRQEAAAKARAGGTSARPAPAPNPAAGRAVEEARRQIGKPYEWGADGPDSFDCSGLTQWAWKAAGKSLPHSSRAQFASTSRIDLDDVQPGDLVFFGNPIHHVGIAIGNGQMIEASQSGTPVRVNSMYRRDYAGAGRVN